MPILDISKEIHSDSFFPGDIAIGLKYCALNPENIYTLKEAELSERLARIHASAQLRTGKIQNVLQEIENHQNYTFFKEQFHKASINRYEIDRKIKDLPEKQKKQAVADADHQYAGVVRPLEHLIGGMEYLAGLNGQLSKESEKAICAIVPGSEELIRGKQPFREVITPKNLEIYFEDADKMLTNMQLAAPKYKDAADSMRKNSKVSVNAGIQYISRYFEATVSRVLDPLYDRAEQRNMAKAIHREDLIKIGGHTVHEILNERLNATDQRMFLRMGLEDKFRKKDIYEVMSPKEVKKETALLVAAALQNDTRVEALIPNGDGKVKPEPVPFIRKGCDVKHLTKVKEGFYQKFLCNMGDPFVEKNEYEDIMEEVL